MLFLDGVGERVVGCNGAGCVRDEGDEEDADADVEVDCSEAMVDLVLPVVVCCGMVSKCLTPFRFSCWPVRVLLC
jgi:hypothetical protein